MNRIFAHHSEPVLNRRIIPVEQAYHQQFQWEMPLREAIATKLFEKESEIAIWAVDNYCELHPSINSPRGSLRRKKGYEDGRHLVRAVGNCILTDSSGPLVDDILTWFGIGDPTFRITAKEVEYFLSFVHQGCKRVLPAGDQAMLDELMEEAKEQTRAGGACWSIKDKASEIAAAMTQILARAKTKTSAAAQQWLRDEDVYDYQHMILALAEALSRSPLRSYEQFTGWLLSHILVHVDCPVETWRMRFSALMLAIGQVLNLDAVRRVEPVLEKCTHHSTRFWDASTVYRVAGLAAHQTARMFLDLHTPMEGHSPTSFVANLQGTSQKLLEGLARLHAADLLNPAHPHATWVWCDEVLPFLPFENLKTIEVYFQALLDQLHRHADEPGMEKFCKECEYFKQVIQAADQTNQLAGQVEEIPNSSSEKQPLPMQEVLPRWLFTSALQCLPGSREKYAVAEYRRWIYDNVLPRFDVHGKIVTAAIDQLQSVMQNWEPTKALQQLKSMLNSASQVVALWAERPSIIKDSEQCMKQAVAACFEVVPDHPARRMGEARTGSRDGLFLIEELIRVLAIGGKPGRERLLRWYRDEIAWTSTLPASGLQAFLHSLVKSMRHYPAIVELLKEVSNATPSMIASQKLYSQSAQTAESATDMVLQQLPEFQAKIGQIGRESFIRDNGMTLRAVARTLWESPNDSAPLTDWVKASIKPYMKFVNATAINNNVECILQCLGTSMDQDELLTVSTRLHVFGEALLAK